MNLKFIPKIVVKYLWLLKLKLFFYKCCRLNDPIWVVGCGRSGTTWLSQLINYDGILREVFEPFHPQLVSDATFLEFNQYVEIGSEFPKLELYSDRVFAGKSIHKYTDSKFNSFSYKGVIVKDIFAGLFAGWMYQRHKSNLRLIYIIRNPFAVALSTYKAKDWIWMTNPRDFFKQKKLQDDYLYNHSKLINEVASKNDYILNQILIWAVVNGIAISQLRLSGAKIVFYEQLLSSPEAELQKIVKYARDQDILDDPRYDKNVIMKRSSTSTKHSSLLDGKSPITSWKLELTDEQLEQGKLILDYFGFLDLYDEDGMPNPEAIRTYHFPLNP